MLTLRHSLALLFCLLLPLSTAACVSEDALFPAPPSSGTSGSSSLSLDTSIKPATQVSAASAAPARQRTLPDFANWMPDVVTAATQVSLPPLPTVGSPELALELDEVYARQTGLTDQIRERVNAWEASGLLRWNEIARQLVARNGTPPPRAARIYALLGVTHYLTLQAVHTWQTRLQRQAPAQLDARIQALGGAAAMSSCPSEAAALAAAAQAILQFSFPTETYAIGQSALEHKESRIWAGQNVRSDLVAGDVIGRAVAAKVLERARADGADEAGKLWAGSVPDLPGAWHSADQTPPLLPKWGQVQPWFMTSSAQFRAPPHPAPTTPAFIAAVNEVRDIAATRTAEQTRIALYWADGAGTGTPPGHWNQIASDVIKQQAIDPLRAAKMLAILNMAMMDAGIAVWETKYHYWLLRPSMSEPSIRLAVSLPNFPSYTSGHSGFSGAASEVLAHFVPEQAMQFRQMAEEASISRVYGGIHYRFDCEEGLKQGRKIAVLALAAAAIY